jgi:hypothetical protein
MLSLQDEFNIQPASSQLQKLGQLQYVEPLSDCFTGVPKATSPQYGKYSTPVELQAASALRGQQSRPAHVYYMREVEAMQAATVTGVAGAGGGPVVYVPSTAVDTSDGNWWIPNSGSLYTAIENTNWNTVVGEEKTVDPMESFYVKGTDELNWKAIHNVFQTENLESLPARIATAIIQAKECGFRESAKR